MPDDPVPPPTHSGEVVGGGLYNDVTDDGPVVTDDDDGPVVREYDDETVEAEYPDTTTVTQYPDGSTVVEFPDGDGFDSPEPLSRWEEYWIAFGARRRLFGAGLIAIVGIGFGIGFADHGDSTTVTTLRFVGRAPSSTPPATPAATPSVFGGSLCIVGQGKTSLFNENIITMAGINEIWHGSISTAAGQQITGSGQITDGIGTISYLITQFTTFTGPSITDPSGRTVTLGPLGPLFPFTVTSDGQPCVQAGVTAPPASAAAPVPPSQSATETTKTTTTHTSTPPWSLGAIPASLLIAFGYLRSGRRPDGVDREPETERAGEDLVRDFDPQSPDYQYWLQDKHREYLKRCDPQVTAVAVAQHEFDDARAALDEAERQNNAQPPVGVGPVPPDDGESARSVARQVLTDAATRQGAARLNLAVAEKRLADCQAGAEAEYSAYVASLNEQPDVGGEEEVPGDTASPEYWDYYYRHQGWRWGEDVMPSPQGNDPRPQKPPTEGPPSTDPPRTEIG